MKKPHTKFFSSLKQVEKRLKLDNSGLPSSTSQLNCTDSIISPLYLGFDPTSNNSSDSEPPPAFLSNSSVTLSTNVSERSQSVESEYDEIEKLMELLGLSEDTDEVGCCNSCNCEGGFYEKIVGVRGPKCGKEIERLDAWIKHFYKAYKEDKGEPLRLAHLLIGKAALHFEDDNSKLDFPSTLEEFLKKDPPHD